VTAIGVDSVRAVAVTGAGGRLGRALVARLGRDLAWRAVAWSRPEFDLDSADPGAQASALLDRDKPALVFHAAAWTDVDGCARDPETANRRNGDAVGGLARACADRGVGLVLVSTNEVFDGRRSDGLGYAETDPAAPTNSYGLSKLLGEEAARAAFGESDRLWIARTAWLYGPPGNDFPTKILAASDRREADEPGSPLPVVADETGSPTFTLDLAAALVELTGAAAGGIYHLVNSGSATRYSWAEAVLRQCRPGRGLRPISQADFARASQPPAWGVLDGSKAAAAGVRLRPWGDALRQYLEALA
jgi:dTDP-4-dehydrorhamnose reductase